MAGTARPARRGAGPRRRRLLPAAALLLAAPVVAAAPPGLAPPGWNATATQFRPPWFFDCSHHAEWTGFKERLAAFWALQKKVGLDSAVVQEQLLKMVVDANIMGKKYEELHVKEMNNYMIYNLCEEHLR